MSVGKLSPPIILHVVVRERCPPQPLLPMAGKRADPEVMKAGEPVLPQFTYLSRELALPLAWAAQ